jgi:hypothetical protein
VNIRNLVPALAIVTLTSTAGFAADTAPAVTFSGWVDSVLAYSDDDTKDIAGGKDTAAGSLRFTGAASLKAGIKVTDKLNAKINLWFDPGTNAVNMREAYWTWALNDTVSWTMGKYINANGLISAEPTGSTFLFVNASLIGFTQTYGNDVLGTSLNIKPKDSPIYGSVHVTNGYYTGSDANSVGYSSPANAGRENTDLGLGLDVIYDLPNGLGGVNFELSYDMHSGSSLYDTLYSTPSTGPLKSLAGGLGGDVLMVGLNATLKPVKILTLGGEVQYMTLGDSEDGGGVTVKDGVDRLQFLLMANVAIEAAPVPMSVTGMVQYIQQDYNFANAETENRFGITAALLTNPLTTSNFGLNFEVGYFDKTSVAGIKDNGTNGADVSGVVVSVEGLLSF